MRTYAECVSSPFLQKLLQDPRVTTFVDTWEIHHPLSCCFPFEIEANPRSDADEIGSRYLTKNVRIFPNTDFCKSLYEITDSLNFGQFANYVSMHYLLKKSLDYQDFDYIIRMRPDAYLLSPINVQKRKGIVFPACSWIDDTYAYSDIMFFGDTKSMHKACNFYEVIDDYVPTKTIPNWHERLFNQYLKHVKIKCRIDTSIRFQIKRPGFPPHYSVGFFDETGGLLEIPRV